MSELRTHFEAKVADSELTSLISEGNIFSIVKDKLWSCLVVLDSLPRTDPFWVPSNNKATVFKLQEFSEKILCKKNPREAAWCKFSVAVLHCSNDVLSERIWEQLRLDPNFSVEWVLDLAWWFEAYADTSQWASNLLIRFGLAREAIKLISKQKPNAAPQKLAWLNNLNVYLKN